MKPTLKTGNANICLTHFLFRIVCNEDRLTVTACNFSLNKPMQYVEAIQDGLELNGTHQFSSMLMSIHWANNTYY